MRRQTEGHRVPGTLIRSAILSGSSELIRVHGRQPANIARRAGIPLAALSDPDILVTARSVMSFFEIAATACGNRNWGLELARTARLAAILGPLWILIRNAGTIRQMCEDLVENFDLYSSAALMGFEPAREGALLSWAAAAGQTESEVQMAEFALNTFCNEFRTLCAPRWKPKAVLFRHAAPRSLRLHRRLFGDDLRFNQERNAILIDRATLDRPLRERAAPTRALVRRVLRLQDTAAGSDNAMKVESIVRGLMPFAPCSVKDVSLAMGVSPRSLQDHLQREGQSFKQIKDRVRADLALKYLQHSSLSVGQIAQLLGYGDMTSFSRSFRRWHGKSAREVRHAEPPSASRK